MRHLGLALLAVLALAGCSSPSSPSSQDDITPLAVGNRWIGEWFSHNDSSNTDELLWHDTTEIVGTMQLSGETWYIQKTYDGVLAFVDTGAAVLLTNRSDGLYSRGWRTDTAIAPFPARRIVVNPASIGDTINTEPIGSLSADAPTGIMYDRVDALSEVVSVPAGQYSANRYETYLAYDSTGRTPQDFGNTAWYAPGVGLVKTVQRGITASAFIGTSVIKIPTSITQGKTIGYRLLNFTHN